MPMSGWNKAWTMPLTKDNHAHFTIIIVLSLHLMVSAQSFGTLTVDNFLMSAPKAYISYGDSIVTGARLGMEECVHQFKWDKWNCPITKPPILAYGHFQPATKELAFARAVTSAGVTYTLTQNCSSGFLQNCDCSGRPKTADPGHHWTWGGCQESFQFALQVSRVFVDQKDDSRDARAFVNLHNNEAGRQSVRRTMTLLCKCHGVSGSCTVKTCWKQLPGFHAVGDYLKSKYKRALLADFKNGLSHPDVVEFKYNMRPSPGLKSIAIKKGNLRRTSLVYLDSSPDYCRNNGTYATLGRQCLRSSDRSTNSPDEKRSCNTICRQCGLRVRKTTVQIETSCDCKFQWCCDVKCKSCVENRNILTCSLL